MLTQLLAMLPLDHSLLIEQWEKKVSIAMILVTVGVVLEGVEYLSKFREKLWFRKLFRLCLHCVDKALRYIKPMEDEIGFIGFLVLVIALVFEWHGASVVSTLQKMDNQALQARVQENDPINMPVNFVRADARFRIEGAPRAFFESLNDYSKGFLLFVSSSEAVPTTNAASLIFRSVSTRAGNEGVTSDGGKISAWLVVNLETLSGVDITDPTGVGGNAKRLGGRSALELLSALDTVGFKKSGPEIPELNITEGTITLEMNGVLIKRFPVGKQRIGGLSERNNFAVTTNVNVEIKKLSKF